MGCSSNRFDSTKPVSLGVACDADRQLSGQSSKENRGAGSGPWAICLLFSASWPPRLGDCCALPTRVRAYAASGSTDGGDARLSVAAAGRFTE